MNKKYERLNRGNKIVFGCNIFTFIVFLILFVSLLTGYDVIIPVSVLGGITLLLAVLNIVLFILKRKCLFDCDKSTLSLNTQDDFWLTHKKDKKFLLYYYITGEDYIEYLCSKVKKGLIISLLASIIIVWAVLCNTALNHIAKNMFVFSMILLIGCVIGIIITIKIDNIYSVNLKFTKQEIEECILNNRLPNGYSSSRHRFVKFCLHFVNFDEESIFNHILTKHKTSTTVDKSNIINDNDKPPKEESIKQIEKPKEVVDNYALIEEKIADFHDCKIDLEELNLILSKQKMSDINFDELRNQAMNCRKISNSEECEADIQVCVKLKREAKLTSANNIYKYIIHKYGMSEVLMKSWAKIFVCSEQLDIAYKLFEIGDISYKNGIKYANIPEENMLMYALIGGVSPSECRLHMQDIERTKTDEIFKKQYIDRVRGYDKSKDIIILN